MILAMALAGCVSNAQETRPAHGTVPSGTTVAEGDALRPPGGLDAAASVFRDESARADASQRGDGSLSIDSAGSSHQPATDPPTTTPPASPSQGGVPAQAVPGAAASGVRQQAGSPQNGAAPGLPTGETTSDPLAFALRERDLIVERLVQTTRRLYQATAAEQRDAMLVEILSSDIGALRTLGLALVEQELADAQRLAPSVGMGIAALLSTPDAKVRASAARLLHRLAQTGVEEQVLDALAYETDKDAAAELLNAAARQPTARLIAPTLRWLTSDGAAREAAAQSGLALVRAGTLTNPEDREAMSVILREIPATRLSPPAIRLFALVGTHEDRASLVPLLVSSDPSTRLAVAESLSADARFVNDVVAAAQQDPALIDTAVRALATHRASLDGLALLQTLPFANQDAKRNATAQLTSAMDLSTLILAADESARDPAFVETLLGRLAETNPPTDPAQAVLHARVLLRLAESRLGQSRPDRTLALIDRITPYASELPDFDVVRYARARTIALVWLDRLEDSALVDSDPEHWLDALAILAAEPIGPEVATVIRSRFAQLLSPAQIERLNSIEARLLTGPRPNRDEQSRERPAEAPPLPAGGAPSGPQ